MGKYAIVIHGGAVTMKPGELTPEEEAHQRQGLRQAVQAGWAILHQGGTALEAVAAAVSSMEDNEHFNAGRGSSLNLQGEVQMDASIMDGSNLKAGAVSSVRYVKNPVQLAHAVLKEGPHVYLTGEGAVEFALRQGLELASPDYFEVDKTRRQWLELVQQEQNEPQQQDTVGAVALDQHGNLAVATSTGGIEGQLKGRVGDSPVLGGGSYASNDACAASCTGDGEVILRGALAHEVYALVKYKGLPIAEACREAISLRDDDLQGDKGIIGIDMQGNIAMECNCNVMRRAYIVGDDEPVVAIWQDE